MFHATNIVFHLVNVCLVFWFIYLLSNKNNLVAALAALLFGIHPMHIESVAWIAELKDVLYGCFFLSSLIVFYLYSQNNAQTKPKIILLAVSFLFFVLSLLSKPAAITLPFMLVLIDFYLHKKQDTRAWIEKIPFLICSILFGLVTLKAQKADHLLHDYYPIYMRVIFGSYAVLGYLFKLVIPTGLANFYPYPALHSGQLPMVYYLSLPVLAVIFYFVYKSLKINRLIAFGFLFFFINLLPVLQFVSFGDAIMADRYTYISYLGLFFVLAMLVVSLFKGDYKHLKVNSSIVTAVIAVAIIACSYLSYARCAVWENDETIATDLYEKFPNDRLVINNLGFILYNQKKYDTAIKLFHKAIELKPDYMMAYINLINSYMAIQDLNNVDKTVEIALKHEPENINLLNVKAFLLYNKHDYQGAIPIYQKAVSIRKDNIDGYLYMANCYIELKDFDHGIQIVDSGLVYAPNNEVLLNNKGYYLFLQGKYQLAIPPLQAALQIDPTNKVATANLNACYKALNDTLGMKH